ncbi:MAG TPA: crosslink repair DNA glycosylase YcaQ family protein [Frankiaceae bacterium]|nr:crosslink repair DNA glycosylase YcaQ family protein [Frankiaceae bacterium]
MDRLHLLQIDSVSALVRSHYLPLFSRLGPYDRAALDKLAWPARGPRHFFETWAHEASLMPVEYEPLLRWRKARALHHEGIWGGPSRLAQERPELVAGLLERVRREGPLSASEVTAPRERTPGAMWDWSDEKRALEWLFVTGQLHVSSRRSSFERLYDVPEHVLPAAVLDAPTPPEAEARAQLLIHAAEALGVATLGDLADYFRMTVPTARPVVAELVASGELVLTAVEGWKQPAYVRTDAAVPRRLSARALLTPFDPVVWERSRAERLFDFDYRIEIYTPAVKRVYGYYVLPFLLGDTLVARVDLKADRTRGVATLHVKGAFAEPGADLGAVAPELAAELAEMARWLVLADIVVDERGDLAPELRRALAVAGGPSSM